MTKKMLLPLVTVVSLAAAGCRLPAPVEQFEAWKNQTLFGTPFPFGGCCGLGACCGAGACDACGPACCEAASGACGDPCCGGLESSAADGCSSCAPGGTVIAPGTPYLPPASSPGPVTSPGNGSLETAPGPETYQPSL